MGDHKKQKSQKIVIFIFLIVLTVVFLAPYFWMLTNSFKSTKEIMLEPERFFPEQFTLESYKKVLTEAPYFDWLKNSIIITGTDTIAILITSSLIGFVFSRYSFKGRKTLFQIILATMMVPGSCLIIPNFILLSSFGWYDKLYALILPCFFSAFGVYLCKQFIDEIPRDIFESAEIDGATDWTIYFRIVVSMIRPAIGSLAIFTSIGFWNDYETPLIFLNSTKKMTLPLALAFFNSKHMTDLSATMAAAALIMLPEMVLFLLLQKQFVKGIAMTGMK